MVKSPFYIVKEFLSPKMCEQIISSVDLSFPNCNSRNEPIKTSKRHEKSESIILDRFEQIVPHVMKYYETTYYGVSNVSFDLYAEGYQTAPALCDNSSIIRGKWSKTSDVDFSCVVFLTEYSDSQLEDDYEAYGAKYEFPTHKFGFNPSKGMLLVYPSGPNFVYGVTSVFAGQALFAKFFIKTDPSFVYNPNSYPGNFKTWF